jgi:hypothetical protein
MHRRSGQLPRRRTDHGIRRMLARQCAARQVRSPANNGRAVTAPLCPFRAKNGSPSAPFTGECYRRGKREKPLPRVPPVPIYLRRSLSWSASRSRHTLLTTGTFHVSFSIEGSSSFGQYIRSINWNLPDGAGNQLASLPAPGLSFWMYRSVEPSEFGMRF